MNTQKFIHTPTYIHTYTYRWTNTVLNHILCLSHQRDDKGFFEAEATGNGEDGTEAREHGSKQNDLPHTRVHGQIGEMVTERGQILLTIKSIL